jgi:hypothetical protein
VVVPRVPCNSRATDRVNPLTVDRCFEGTPFQTAEQEVLNCKEEEEEEEECDESHVVLQETLRQTIAGCDP